MTTNIIRYSFCSGLLVLLCLSVATLEDNNILDALFAVSVLGVIVLHANKNKSIWRWYYRTNLNILKNFLK